MQPKLFIGSSTEALEVAYAIQENLEGNVLSKVWTQGIFELSGHALQNLLDALSEFDFALFIFQPDDVTRIRAETAKSVRDNVIFEMGLFISRLGKDRVYFLVPKVAQGLHLPTDLMGLEPGHYMPPSKPEDLLAALGPFCNKVRRLILTKGPLDKSAHPQAPKQSSVPSSPSKSSDSDLGRNIKVEIGVKQDSFGNTTIFSVPTLFFDRRVGESFPGVRGLQWFNDPKESLNRLTSLFREPLEFEQADGFGVTRDPIWWFRAGSSNPVRVFMRLSDTRCRLDEQELEVDKLAVFRSRFPWQSYIYLETKSDPPIGIRPVTETYIEEMQSSFGYAWEEYAVFQGTPITRECYEDGAAVIDGILTDTGGADLRTHYLSRYNLLITSKFSTINNHKFDSVSQPILNDMLHGKDRFAELHSLIEKLPRHLADG